MKQHHLSTKFLRFYIGIGILGFFLVTLVGSYLVEKHYEHFLSSTLYKEGYNIASSDQVKASMDSKNISDLRPELSAIATFQDAVVWIINSQGELNYSTAEDIDPAHPIPLDNFNGSIWNNNYYEVGDFQGYFPTSHLSIVVPVSSDKNILGYEETAQTLSYYTSPGNTASDTAFWFEGFLKSSGTILLLDDQLWDLVNSWLASLNDDSFMELLPILRRTFSEYSLPERRKLGEKAKGSSSVKRVSIKSGVFNKEDARKVIPLMEQLLGIDGFCEI